MTEKNLIISKLNQFSDVILALGVVTIVIMMIIPLPPFLLDLLLALNITLSLTIVMISIYNVEPLQFSVFPSLLLVTQGFTWSAFVLTFTGAVLGIVALSV